MLAHQGGWDEMLFVLLPIAIFAGLLALANRRASSMVAPEPPSDDADTSGPDEATSDGPDLDDGHPGSGG